MHINYRYTKMYYTKLSFKFSFLKNQNDAKIKRTMDFINM